MRRTAALIVGGGPAGSAAAIALARGGARPELIERTAAITTWSAAASSAGTRWPAAAARPRSRSAGRAADPAAAAGRGRHAPSRRTLPAAAGLSRRRLDRRLARRGRAGRGRRHARPRRPRRRGGPVAARRRRMRSRPRPCSSPPASTSCAASPVRSTSGASRRPPGCAPLCRRAPTSTPRSPGSSSCICSTAAMPACCCRRTAPPISASRSRGAAGRRRLARGAGRRAGGGGAVAGRAARRRPAVELGGDRRRPYGWRAAATEPGLFRVGDQAAVIASLAGDGIAVALASGEAAARAWLAGGPGASVDYQRGFARRAARPVGIAEALRHAAERGLPRQAMTGCAGARRPGAAAHRLPAPRSEGEGKVAPGDGADHRRRVARHWPDWRFLAHRRAGRIGQRQRSVARRRAAGRGGCVRERAAARRR